MYYSSLGYAIKRMNNGDKGFLSLVSCEKIWQILEERMIVPNGLILKIVPLLWSGHPFSPSIMKSPFWSLYFYQLGNVRPCPNGRQCRHPLTLTWHPLRLAWPNLIFNKPINA